MIDSKIAVEGPKAHSPEWYDIRFFDPDRERPVVITASESAAACGASPYQTALELYMTKRREMEAWEPDDEQKERMRFGQRMESVVIDEYKNQNDCEVETDLPLYLSNRFEFLGATPDAFARKDEDVWELEAKNSNWRMFDQSGEDENKYGEAGTDQVPAYMMFQAQQQMIVLGLNRVDFPVLQNGNRMLIYRVEAYEALQNKIIECGKELAERIINGEPPDPDYTHDGTAKLLQEMYGVSVGTVIELDVDAEELWFRQIEIAEKIKELEAEKKAIKNKMLDMMGDAEIARFPGRNFKLKRTAIDDSYWTEQDVQKIVIGDIKRRGHIRITKSKDK